MNIGIVTTWFERGAAYVSRAYHDVLSPQHDVFIYARGGEKYAQGDPRWDLPYVTWGKPMEQRLVTTIHWHDFQSWVRRCRLDAILFNEQHSWEVIVLLRRKFKIPITTYVDYYTPETVPLFWLYDALFCNTQRHYGVFKDHPGCHYMPWGTDVSLFAPQGPMEVRDHLRFFHSCGMDSFRKGTDLVMRAFQQVRMPSHLLIHSQGPPSRELQEIMRLDHRIEWVTAEVSAPGLYHRGDVYVYPTRLEGVGLTVSEALACGCPVITTNAPPMNEFVRHGVNGRLVKVREERRREDNYYWPESLCDETDLAAAMQFYVDHHFDLPLFRHQARAYALEHLDWRKNADELPEIFEKLREHRRNVPEALMRDAMRFEHQRYGGTLRYRLAQLGARKVKHQVKALLKRSR